MSFGQFLSILRARGWIVALVLALTVVATMAVSLMLPKRYTAVAGVVIDLKPDPLSAIAFGGLPSPVYMATQVDIINSERVALRVVRNLKLADNPQVRQRWIDETGGQGSLESWIGAEFSRQMEVAPSRESSVIRIAYSAPDPRFAAGLANAFAQAYIETALELRTEPARLFNDFFDLRTKEARQQLEAAQAKLSEFQQANGIIASDERVDIENARLNELSSQLTAIQALATDSSLRQAQAAGGDASSLQDVLNNPLVAGLRADINRSEASMQQLTTRLGDRHPQVIEARATLAELRQRLEAETAKVAGSVGTTSRINNQREAELRRALAAQRAKVLQMKAVRDEGMVLLQDMANAQRTYDALLQRSTQTSLESQATQSNVNLLTQASPPLEPSSPNLLLNGVLSVFLGLLLALGTAFAIELIDRRVRSPEDIVTALGLPVIGSMPRAGSRLALSARRMAAPRRLAAPRA